jgi:large subunit ribosomal protein L24
MPIDISNVMYCCPKCDKGVRLGVKMLESGKKARYCKACGEIIDKD